MINDFTMAREKESELLLRNTTQGNHTLLLGRSGVGKTHLLLNLQRTLKKHVSSIAEEHFLSGVEGSSRKKIPHPDDHMAVHRRSPIGISERSDAAIHYIPRPVPAKETIENIYTWLAMLAGVALPRRISRETRIADYGAFIAELLSHPSHAGRRIVLMADDFDHLPVLAVPIFEILAERICLVAAARSRNGGARFNRLLWRFEELQIDPLSPQDARSLSTRAVETVPGIKLPNERVREFLVTRIATLSNGIPSAVIESVERLRGAEHIDEAYIREIFVHRSADTFFDATPLILAFFAFLVVMRYINRGMYQFDMYAIFGALSGMMLLARWFMMRTSREER